MWVILFQLQCSLVSVQQGLTAYHFCTIQSFIKIPSSQKTGGSLFFKFIYISIHWNNSSPGSRGVAIQILTKCVRWGMWNRSQLNLVNATAKSRWSRKTPDAHSADVNSEDLWYSRHEFESYLSHVLSGRKRIFLINDTKTQRGRKRRLKESDWQRGPCFEE